MTMVKLPETLAKFCEEILQEFDLIPEARKKQLEELGAYISNKAAQKLPIAINVICTHNSRRSHIGQLWLQVAAIWYGVENFKTYSGGTEATAFNHRSVAALRKAGFELVQETEGENPVYEINLPQESEETHQLFSKKYSHEINPEKDFAAIMVCTEADKGCPFIPGADARFAISYDDPKNFDDTDLESEKYEERVRQIGREFFYAMKSI